MAKKSAWPECECTASLEYACVRPKWSKDPRRQARQRLPIGRALIHGKVLSQPSNIWKELESIIHWFQVWVLNLPVVGTFSKANGIRPAATARSKQFHNHLVEVKNSRQDSNWSDRDDGLQSRRAVGIQPAQMIWGPNSLRKWKKFMTQSCWLREPN